MIAKLKTPIGRFKIVAFVEGLSFLLILFITMPLKYWMDMPTPNKVIGMAHGILFIAYIALSVEMRMEYRWGLKKTLLALLASILPFGTFYFVHKYFS